MFDTAEPKKAYEVKQDDETFEALMKAPWTNDTKAKAVELAGNDRVKLQVIANKGLTKEESAAQRNSELANANAEFIRTGKYDPSKYKISYSKGKASLVRK